MSWALKSLHTGSLSLCIHASCPLPGVQLFRPRSIAAYSYLSKGIVQFGSGSV